MIGVKQPWYCIVIHDVDFKFTHPNASSYTLNVHTGKYDKFIYKAFDTSAYCVEILWIHNKHL